jgi:radical SAM superfamily enzyme YgiQ (UPF0313 family)
MAPSIFLLNPPSLPGTTANREGAAGMGAQADAVDGFLYPPHFLATAGAALRGAGWRVKALDAAVLGLDHDTTLRRLPRADVLVFPVSFATLAADRAFLNRLRDVQPLAKVLVAGPALAYPQVAHAFDDLADLLVSGEAELALAPATRRLLTGECRPGEVFNPYALAQSAYQPDGLVRDLDLLPNPAWDLFLEQGRSYPFLTMFSSRGCPASCSYCPYVVAQGHEHRSQTPARTVEEMTYLAEHFRPGRVMFRDPVFAHDRNRVLALCTEIRHSRLQMPWECESRPEHLDGRLLRAMAAAGCVTVKLGLETADPELLVAIGRVPNERSAEAYLQQSRAVIAQCRELGITCRVFVLAGLPGEVMAAVETTAEFLQQVRPARLHVKQYQWYPGIASPQAGGPDASAQKVWLEKAAQQPLPPWRRLMKRLVG